MDFNLFINIVAITETLISIFIGILTEQYYMCLVLVIINLVILIILGVVMIPEANKIAKYRNLIKNNKYYSFIYASYIDMEEPNKKSKISDLRVVIKIEKKDKQIKDVRRYSFKCRSKRNSIYLFFLNELGSIEKPELQVESQPINENWSGIGNDLDIHGIPDIIVKLIVRLPRKLEEIRSVNLEYRKTYAINKDNSLIYVIYPKMFSNYRKEMSIKIEVANGMGEKCYFFLTSFGKDSKDEGILTQDNDGGNIFSWVGKVDPRRIYIIKGKFS